MVEAAFKAQVEFVRTWEAGKTADAADLNQAYALYKQSTAGDAPKDAPDRAYGNKLEQYEGWVKQKGKSKEAAMQEYTAFIEKAKLKYVDTKPDVKYDAEGEVGAR